MSRQWILGCLVAVLAACSSSPDLPDDGGSQVTEIEGFGVNPSPVPSNVAAQFSWTVYGHDLVCKLDVEGDGRVDYTVQSCTSHSRVSHIYGNQGTYTARLEVTGADGVVKKRDTEVKILAPNTPPTIPVFTPLQPDMASGDALLVQFNWTVGDIDADITHCRLDAESDGVWDYDGLCSGLTSGSQVGQASTVNFRFHHKYGRAGQYLATLEAADPYSATRSQVKVRAPWNRAPQVEQFAATPGQDNTAELTFRVSDADNDPLDCILEIESLGKFRYPECGTLTRNLRFAASANYRATLTVSDPHSQTRAALVIPLGGGQKIPVQFKDLSLGSSHTCGLTAAPTGPLDPPEGTAYCWGYGKDGELGTDRLAELGDILDSDTGEAIGSSVPVPVTMPAGVTFASIHLGGSTACALTAEGTAYCWGKGPLGLGLGDGFLDDNSYIPRPVVGGHSFKKISVGPYYLTCGITLDEDDLYCWGRDEWEELGDGAGAVNQKSPQQVVYSNTPSGTKFKGIYVGFARACTVLESASVTYRYCWGRNGPTRSTLGFDTTSPDVSIPSKGAQVHAGTSDPNLIANLDVIDALQVKSMQWGPHAGCLLVNTNSQVQCWGSHNFNTGVPTGVAIPGSVDVASLSSGYASSMPSINDGFYCAVDVVGTGWCWGSNYGGQLGTGAAAWSNTFISAPVDPVVMPAGVTLERILVGGARACGFASDGQIYCWGLGTNGELGMGLEVAYVELAVTTPRLFAPTITVP
jgi:alpha-tubulin suppressor-like RCC1 family protein